MLQLYFSYNSEVCLEKKEKRARKTTAPQPKEEKKQSKPYNKVIDLTAVTQKD
jgi:hypothetical protein